MSKASRMNLMASVLGAGVLSLTPLLSGPAMADTVLQGNDYLYTVLGTEIVIGGTVIPLASNPIGVAPNGGSYDTVIQRTQDVVLNGTTPIQAQALSLQGNLGGQPFYVTLDPTQASLGSMTIDGTRDGGTFSSVLNVNFDVCTGGFGAAGVGCGGGTLVGTGYESFAGSGTWTGSPFSVDYPGYVYFKPGPFAEVGATGQGYLDWPNVYVGTLDSSVHAVDPAPGPVPGTGLLALALLSLAGVASKARRWLNG